MVKKMKVTYVGGTSEEISFTKKSTLKTEIVFHLPNGKRKSINSVNVLSIEEL